MTEQLPQTEAKFSHHRVTQRKQRFAPMKRMVWTDFLIREHGVKVKSPTVNVKSATVNV